MLQQLRSCSVAHTAPCTLPTHPPTPARFEREALGGRLWHAACQAAAAGDIGDQIPLSFGSRECAEAAANAVPAALHTTG